MWSVIRGIFLFLKLLVVFSELIEALADAKLITMSGSFSLTLSGRLIKTLSVLCLVRLEVSVTRRDDKTNSTDPLQISQTASSVGS